MDQIICGKMIKFTHLCLLLLLAFAAAQQDAVHDDEEVERVQKICLQKRFYLHQYYLGCEADFEEDDVKKVCPYRFRCPKLENSGSETQCHVDGKAYNPSERVPNDNKCRECFCGHPDKKRGLPPRVECSAIECKNVEPLIQTKEHECYYTFNKADSCCPKRECIVRNTTATCEYNGAKFHNGQKIFPVENPCQVCLCNDRFTGVNGPTCKRVECDMKVERERLLEGCVPVYFQASCCPVDWICPVKVLGYPDNMSQDKCYFDGEEYDLGSDLENAHPSSCIQCKCVAPNMFTCIQEACPPPPRPKRGYQCVPKDNKGACCPEFDCSKRIVDPCESKRCNRGDRCVRFLEECRKPPCNDYAECVPDDYRPCDDYQCQKGQVCVTHTFPCPARNCPIRSACLPVDPCADANLQCSSDKICRNVIKPCDNPPCPKVAECVDKDPCKEHRCRPNHECHSISIPECRREPCPKDPVCASPNCAQPRCDRNSVYRPFGKGKDNCAWCEPIPQRRPQRRQRPAQRQ